MARPTKQGIDYFPLDTEFDDKVELFIAENGPESLSILITVWQLIYKNEGYFIPYNDDLFLLVKRRLIMETGKIGEVIDASVRRGIFSSAQFNKNKIITSPAIQKRWLLITQRRKAVYVNKNYLCSEINVGDNHNIVWVNDHKNTTKESKVKEKNKYYPDFDNENRVCEEEFYRSKKGRKLTGEVLQAFKQFWKTFSWFHGKAEAADAFLDVYKPSLFDAMIRGAELESQGRQLIIDNGNKPKWAQGWLSGRRWEDYTDGDTRPLRSWK